MSLNLIDISNLRNIEKASMEAHPDLNVIVGPNGSGKTSFLEAIYILGRGRSFRASTSKKVIKEDKSSLTIVAKIGEKNIHTLGLQITGKGFRAKRDGEYVKKTSELALTLPLLLISPDADKLIQGSPRQRRRFLDWGLFHVEHEYLSYWKKYNRVLIQRNTLLKKGGLNNIETWNRQLLSIGGTLTQYRLVYTTALRELFQRYSNVLTNELALDLKYQPGWGGDETFESSLLKSIDRDIKTGYTQKGPHRADIGITSAGRKADNYLSGGQQKLAACALILAQAKLLSEKLKHRGLLLVDDLPAELDARHRKQFLHLLSNINSQIFITTTDLGLLTLESFSGYNVFHVEHGQISVFKKT